MTSGVDNFSSYAPGLDAPAHNAIAVVPHDTNELATYSRALYIGGAGDVTVIMAGDSTAVTFAAVPVGSILPIRARIVKNTATTASLILALY